MYNLVMPLWLTARGIKVFHSSIHLAMIMRGLVYVNESLRTILFS
jgi:GTP cyclohydrolase I